MTILTKVNPMTREWHFWVYILASKSRRIYTGVTNDIERRVKEHRSGEIEGFTQRYKINRLVYRERFHYIGNAIAREKEIKGWDRAKRVALIESENPTWEDLSLEWGKPIEMLNPAATGKQQIPRFARDDNSVGSGVVDEQNAPDSASDDSFDGSNSVAEFQELLIEKK